MKVTYKLKDWPSGTYSEVRVLDDETIQELCDLWLAKIRGDFPAETFLVEMELDLRLTLAKPIPAEVVDVFQEDSEDEIEDVAADGLSGKP